MAEQPCLWSSNPHDVLAKNDHDSYILWRLRVYTYNNYCCYYGCYYYYDYYYLIIISVIIVKFVISRNSIISVGRLVGRWGPKFLFFLNLHDYQWNLSQKVMSNHFRALMMVSKGNHPQVAELFRLVKHSNLPRCSV